MIFKHKTLSKNFYLLLMAMFICCPLWAQEYKALIDWNDLDMLIEATDVDSSDFDFLS